MGKMKIRLVSIIAIFYIIAFSLLSPALACMDEAAGAEGQNMMTGAAIINNTTSISGFLGLIEQLLIIIVLVLLTIFLVRKISKK